MDQGFHAAFSVSGTLLDQFERWDSDMLDLLTTFSRHKNSEMLCQTYYHSISSLFQDQTEFADQFVMHRDRIKELSGKTPIICENTEFLFNNIIADTMHGLGFQGCFTEGTANFLGWRSPNFLYQCREIPLIVRNFGLSDDIAFRFCLHNWKEYPLTADKYASWVADAYGDFISVFIDYETIGEHFWKESGIFDFFSHLPEELAKRGVQTVNPSNLLQYPVKETFSIDHTVSWADAEKDETAWIQNRKQRNAFRACERAAQFPLDRHLYGLLQTSDHFYYMSTKHGSCGEVHNYFSHQSERDAFITYMRTIADVETEALHDASSKDPSTSRQAHLQALYKLRSLAPHEAFHFTGDYGYTGHVAYDLDQFSDLIGIIPSDSLEYHIKNHDFANWIHDIVQDEVLADQVRYMKSREGIMDSVEKRCEELWQV
jgi:alpha-amylase